MDESGTELRGRLSLSAATWVSALFAVVVLGCDLVVVAVWLLRGRPTGSLYLTAGAILALLTVVLAGTVALSAADVRRQRYLIDRHGITVRGRVHVPWSRIVELERVYSEKPRDRSVAIAVHQWTPRTSPYDGPAEQPSYDPLYLDVTDVPGGTVRFFALVRRYAPPHVRLR
ncbi:MAG TPA: hypothetical protein VF054_18545 [Micromonosporaceae bacterium]